jgi:deazaflavin-dependent oxidoreductase (nitroreductase family)
LASRIEETRIKKKQPYHWQRLIQRVVSAQPVTRFFSYFLHYVDRPMLRLSNGRFSPAGFFTGLPITLLTTTGAKSGQPRTIPIVAIPYQDEIVLIASNWGGFHHPAWYYNLRAHPQAVLLRDGRQATYLARFAGAGERERYWQAAVAIYPGYAAYQRRTAGRQIPIMVLTPLS